MTAAPKSAPFTSVLVANRGEIACRVMRTAKSMGIRTVAVYSDADADAPHVRLADAAVRIGPAPVGESYLKAECIIEAAREAGAEAIHPGYGFLSENAAFARAVAAAGIVFVGPPADAVDIMGDKARAKRRMIDAGVPCIPGYQGADQSDAALAAAAREIGFPLMIKAAAGGGGRGMRRVESEAALAGAIRTARSEAENAFGAGDLILERALEKARHIEIQVFADNHGNVIHLGERDCSVQRRHQKVIEEAPSPAVSASLREEMGAAAVRAAKEIGYSGAGTVEFMLDASGAFYFLEMNTRLQVEHPVTEMITGLDLVALQFKVAAGERLGLAQDDVGLCGHAIEARLYAEDPDNDFLPASGDIALWRPAPGARTDAGIRTGGAVSPYYDPMLAKVIARGATRDEARRRLIAALEETAAFGVATNRGFLIDVLRHQVFVEGEATTDFLGAAFTREAASLTPETAAIAAAMLHCARMEASFQLASGAPRSLAGWTSASRFPLAFRFGSGDAPINVAVTATGPDAYSANANGAEFRIVIEEWQAPDATLRINGARRRALAHVPAPSPGAASIFLGYGGGDHALTDELAVISDASERAGEGAVVAPMHGLIVELAAAVGDTVRKGQRVGVLEAMKMQHELIAPIDGKVAAVHCRSGDQTAARAVILEIEPAG